MPRLIKVDCDGCHINPGHVVTVEPHNGGRWVGSHTEILVKSEIVLVTGRHIFSELTVEELLSLIEEASWPPITSR